MYFENFDLENIITPVDTRQLRYLLECSGYDTVKTDQLIDSFDNGFSLGYEGPSDVKIKSSNFRGVSNKMILWNKVMKEVRLKRFAGPFESIPFDDYIQSPIGPVPKDDGKEVHLIFHLSYPRGNRKTSVNANTDKNKCSVVYPSFDEAIQLCIAEGKSCNLCKSDMTSTFRNLGMKKSHWRYLVMKCESPIDGKMYYFVDKCLPFGASISCAYFQGFSNALAHFVKWRTKKELINYLDDFLFVALMRALCEQQLQVFLDICKTINFPVSLDKTFWGSIKMVFLGLLINTVRQLVMIPAKKVQRARQLIDTVLAKRKIMVKQLQKICGFLNFLGKCIVPGRAFTRRLYAYSSGLEYKFKPHYHIKLNNEIRKDLSMWRDCIEHQSIYSRPFMDFSKDTNSEVINFYSDASGNSLLGFGGICGNSWMYGQWGPNFMLENEPSIEYLELFAVLASALSWLHRFKNRRITIFCDNQSVVAMINASMSSCKNCLQLLRHFILFSLKINTKVTAKYVASKDNRKSDQLSRLKIDQFKEENSDSDRYPTPIPDDLWPMDKIWLN